MKRRYLLIACGLLLVPYIFWAYEPFVFFKDTNRLSYLMYTETFENIAFVTILLFFTGVVSSIPGTLETGIDYSSGYKYWSLSFWGFILSLIGLIVYVNPHGVFPWQYVPNVNTAAFIPTAARSQKLELYRDLALPPEVVILGSSRAFTLPSAYVENLTGYRTFNMAINGGGPLDFLPLGKMILSRQADRPPLVFLVELIAPDFDVPEATLPISLIPYLSLTRGYNTTLDTLHDVISLQSVSDAVYQLTFANFLTNQPAMTFKQDGTGVRRDISKNSYIKRIKTLTVINDEMYKCDTLSDQGLRQIELLIELAQENRTAVLFYRSPLNADYLDTGDLDHPLYQKCETLFLDMMEKLVAANPNVFYHDLTYYEPISSLRWDGYYDVHHLKPNAARMLIDVLAPDIHQAATWALGEGY